jgi:Cdc6-like AAA superfamily ATPase
MAAGTPRGNRWHLIPRSYTMFCSLADLKNESDVEQKLLWPLLTTPAPSGLGLLPSDILTKTSIRRLEIDKGASRRLYYPDYLVVLAGLPVLVIEAKAPGVGNESALAEARLYGNEINALFPTGTNPCTRVIACNGNQLASSPLDTTEPDVFLQFSELSAATVGFAALVDRCQRSALQEKADAIRRSFRKEKYFCPRALVGGPGFQNEELPANTFGATIVGDYGHVFSPRTREDRERVVRHAYIQSLRRQRFLEPIERLIRTAVAPATRSIRTVADTSAPTELLDVLRERRGLEHQVLLLVGSVGSGKSTFIDYVSMVALPDELRARTVWVRVNLNKAPLSTDVAYNWLAKEIASELRAQLEDQDVDDLKVLEKVFRGPLSALKRGALALLDPTSNEYRTRLADALLRLQTNEIEFAKAVAAYVCAGPGKLLVVVLDNCDKRTRDEQLTMFQIAQWVQTEFRCLVVLPLRDITFDLHRNQPPLDTALKALTFRIEPPQFTEVLQARVRLALDEMHANATAAHTLSFVLPNGIRVSYPAADQALYLASILQSLFAHDRFVRRVMTGLAGRDVRRALEIFLDFCMSGHIGEDEIYKIRFLEGKYVLPLSVVARVLLRMQRRFYDGDRAHLKNLVQCNPDDALPDHFVRLSILHWLQQRDRIEGPAGIRGFQRAGLLIKDLVQLGHDSRRLWEDLRYLIREGLIIAEHQLLDKLNHEDLVRITASGLVHLQLMANPEYLAGCAEDTWIADQALANRIATRIGARSRAGHLSRTTTSKNAWELVEYLHAQAGERVAAPDVYLEREGAAELRTLKEAEAAVGATEIEVSKRLYVSGLAVGTTDAGLRREFEAHDIGVVKVEFPSGSTSCDGRGFGFVEVVDGRGAMRALDSTDFHIGGRQLTIAEAYRPSSDGPITRRHPRTGGLDLHRLYVGNLPYSSTERSVQAQFESHGLHPREVYLGLNRATGRALGWAIVSMESSDQVDQAIGALNGSIVEGRSIYVKPAHT